MNTSTSSNAAIPNQNQTTGTARSIPSESALSEALSTILGGDALQVLEQLSPSQVSKVNALLLQFLSTAEGATALFAPETPKQYQKSAAPDWLQPEKGLRFIRVTEGACELALPLLGVALTCLEMTHAGNPSHLAPSLLESARSIWKNVVTLRPPDDKDAIDVSRCLLRSGAIQTILKRQDSKVSTEELINQSGLTKNRVVEALRKLHNQKIIKASWADQSGNFNESRNKWWIAL